MKEGKSFLQLKKRNNNKNLFYIINFTLSNRAHFRLKIINMEQSNIHKLLFTVRITVVMTFKSTEEKLTKKIFVLSLI